MLTAKKEKLSSALNCAIPLATCTHCYVLMPSPLLLSGLPEVTIVPSKYKIQEGGNLTFQCHVTGSPTPSVRWRTEELHSHFFTQVVKNVQYMCICMSHTGIKKLHFLVGTHVPLCTTFIVSWKMGSLLCSLKGGSPATLVKNVQKDQRKGQHYSDSYLHYIYLQASVPKPHCHRPELVWPEARVCLYNQDSMFWLISLPINMLFFPLFYFDPTLFMLSSFNLKMLFTVSNSCCLSVGPGCLCVDR